MRFLLALLLVLAPACASDGGVEGPDDDRGGEVDGPAVTRSEAVLGADRYALVRWTMTEENRRGTACGGLFVSDYTVGDRIGMGYKWGGWDDVETFLVKMGEGHATGTGGYVDYDVVPFDCVAGISCTGLVSRAWRLDHKHTLDYPARPDIPRQLDDITRPVAGVDFRSRERGDLRRGDALMNATHVMLFLYVTRDGYPVVIDSRSEGVALRKTSWGFLDAYGYEAIRYNNIVDGPPPRGTVERPFAVSSRNGRFHARGNTRDAVSMRIDWYPTDPSRREQGPENVYLLDLDRASEVTIEISDDRRARIDNDVFLLSSTRTDGDRRAVDCIAGDDRRISRALGPGRYWIVVDSGWDLPGEYLIDVDW